MKLKQQGGWYSLPLHIVLTPYDVNFAARNAPCSIHKARYKLNRLIVTKFNYARGIRSITVMLLFILTGAKSHVFENSRAAGCALLINGVTF